MQREVQDLIPVEDLSQREFVSRLRGLVDFVKDPEKRSLYPQEFARKYSRLINLSYRYEYLFDRKYVIHNLGKKRIAYIRNLMGRVRDN